MRAADRELITRAYAAFNARDVDAVLAVMQRPGGMLVLTGFGHSDRGPFDFEVSRKK